MPGRTTACARRNESFVAPIVEDVHDNTQQRFVALLLFAMSTAQAQPRETQFPEELLGSTLFLLARLGFALKARLVEEFEQAGFSIYQYGVLATLSEGA